jgi:preprotein translocase subunit YajC
VEMIIVLALGVGAMWLMTNRTRKQQREALSFRDNLQPGQEVQTGSGLIGTVVAVEDGVVTLETGSDGAQTRWVIAAIARLVEPPVADDEDDVDEDGDDSEWRDEEGAIPPGLLEVPDDLSSLQPPRDDDSDDPKKNQK